MFLIHVDYLCLFYKSNHGMNLSRFHLSQRYQWTLSTPTRWVPGGAALPQASRWRVILMTKVMLQLFCYWSATMMVVDSWCMLLALGCRSGLVGHLRVSMVVEVMERRMVDPTAVLSASVRFWRFTVQSKFIIPCQRFIEFITNFLSKSTQRFSLSLFC